MPTEGDENTGDPPIQPHADITIHIQQGSHDMAIMSIRSVEHKVDSPPIPLGLPNQGWEIPKEKV